MAAGTRAVLIEGTLGCEDGIERGGRVFVPSTEGFSYNVVITG